MLLPFYYLFYCSQFMYEFDMFLYCIFDITCITIKSGPCHCRPGRPEPSGRIAVRVAVCFVVCHRRDLVSLLVGHYPEELRPVFGERVRRRHPVCAVASRLSTFAGPVHRGSLGREKSVGCINLNLWFRSEILFHTLCTYKTLVTIRTLYTKCFDVENIFFNFIDKLQMC